LVGGLGSVVGEDVSVPVPGKPACLLNNKPRLCVKGTNSVKQRSVQLAPQTLDLSKTLAISI
jgi:hypothetical protein